MGSSFCSHLHSNKVITTIFCTRPNDSCTVVACAKLCCDLTANYWITTTRSFHRIWIASTKSLLKWAPAQRVRDNASRKCACDINHGMENTFHITGSMPGESISHQDSPHKGPIMQSFDVVFVVHLDMQLNKQSGHHSHVTSDAMTLMWRDCNDIWDYNGSV